MKSRSKPTCFVPAYSPPKLGGEPEASPYFLRLRAIALALRAGSRFAVRASTPPNLGGVLKEADHEENIRLSADQHRRSDTDLVAAWDGRRSLRRRDGPPDPIKEPSQASAHVFGRYQEDRQPALHQGNSARRRADRRADEIGGDRRIGCVGEEISHVGSGLQDDLVAGATQRIHFRRRPVAGSLVPVFARCLLLLAQRRIHLLRGYR